MVIQSYNVNVSSQRTSLSVQSSTATATRNLNTAQSAGTTGQEGNTGAVNEKAAGQQNQNENGQGQNQNGQGQNQNGQGQNVNNQGQSNKDAFKTLLKSARDENVGRLAKGSSVSHVLNARDYKMPTTPQELRAKLSQLIYEMLTGRYSKLKHNPHKQFEAFNAGRHLDVSSFFGGAFGIESVQRPQGMAQWQMESFQYESETVTYQANGVVHTADGRTINVDINMQMSRQFVSYMSMSGESMTLVDPLVINYGGTAASLMGEKFLFDLTMNGSMDSLSILGEGSGFLAIDRNGDGKINDGSELFGPSTGCGFDELRKYDTDGNGWIDENDEIFDKLVVWRRDEQGNDIVYTLRELGIGAIFLGDISTEYSFKSERNETLGVMRSTSFFLKQCGGAGTLSHIDLAL